MRVPLTFLLWRGEVTRIIGRQFLALYSTEPLALDRSANDAAPCQPAQRPKWSADVPRAEGPSCGSLGGSESDERRLRSTVVELVLPGGWLVLRGLRWNNRAKAGNR